MLMRWSANYIPQTHRSVGFPELGFTCENLVCLKKKVRETHWSSLIKHMKGLPTARHVHSALKV